MPELLTKACCGDSTVDAAVPGAPVIVLVGNPNVGKSTLFNALTGARQHVGNWPGKTVQVARGRWQTAGGTREVVDLPGTYSLVPRTPDEALTCELLVGDAHSRPDLVVVTADAANLARNLYLVAEILQAGVRCVVALTMSDIAKARGIEIDSSALAEHLSTPVVPVIPRKRQGLADLAAAVERALTATEPARPLSLPALSTAAEESDPPTVSDSALADDQDLLAAEARYAWVHEVVAVVRTTRGNADRLTVTDRVDRVLTSRWFGIPVFLTAMWLVFTATTTLAKPFQEGLDGIFSGPVSDAATRVLSGAPDWLSGLVVDGLIGGVGQLLTFVPLMVIMFVLLAVLEDSGYMARAAFVVDRLMRRLGLPGRAFLPIIIGFGCNVPALAGLRILGNRRQRLLVGMIVPYVSCSARLTVYVLLASIFFGNSAGTVVFAMYVVSVLLVIGIGMLLRNTLFRDLHAEGLVLELPPYRLPTFRVVGTQTWQKLAAFLKTAGGIIVATVVAVWLLAAIPLGAAVGTGFGQAPIEHSVFGAGSRAVAPAFAPAGFDDWHASAALATGFVAKEAVVATIAQTYGTDEPDEDAAGSSLGIRLHATFDETSDGHPLPAVLAFMVFLLAYTPCMATVAAQWQEMGSRMTLVSTGLQLAVAWVLAVAVFQAGSLWW